LKNSPAYSIYSAIVDGHLAVMPSLADLTDGQFGTIVEVIGDDTVAIRLMEMGLTDGERVKLVGRAPMGDPLEILIRSYKLSLRRSEAVRVLVEVAK
jgi:ferrous iron transport protein A